VQADLYHLAPHAAKDYIEGALGLKTKGLEVQTATNKLALDTLSLEATQFEHAARGLSLVTDQASYRAWLLANSTHLPPVILAKLPPPEQFTPALVPQIQANAQALATQFEQRLAQQKSTNETTTARRSHAGAEQVSPSRAEG
jgi:hypothetical protein